MRFRFDGNQLYQQRAIASVVDLFQGWDRKTTPAAFQVGFYSGEYEVASFVLDDARLLANLAKTKGS
jgi:hypothetical protein